MYFDSAILDWTTEKWRLLPNSVREEILFTFWIQTSWGPQFPCIMNLAKEDSIGGSSALRAFMALFPENNRQIDKNGVSQAFLNTEKPYKVRLMWRDSTNKVFTVIGTSDISLSYAQANGAEKAFRKVFNNRDIGILKHVQWLHFVLNVDGFRVDRRALWERLIEAKMREQGETLTSGQVDSHTDVPNCTKGEQKMEQELEQQRSTMPKAQPIARNRAMLPDLNDLTAQSPSVGLPYLPFDKIFGYVLPQEAALALEELFEDCKEAKPRFHMKKHFHARVSIGSQVFQAFGESEEEAKDEVAKMALMSLMKAEEL